VVTLVDPIPEKVDLLGHSYGAICSLEAALLTTNINSLVLYEPPVYTTIDIPYPEDALDRYNGYIEAGEAEKALLMMYEIGGASTDELNRLRSHPIWQARVLLAHTIPREQISVKSYYFDPRRLIDLKIPTTLILRGESAPFYKAATETLYAALPQSQA
jgi:pimeloyl-ACP methyl ester carboxylesterase